MNLTPELILALGSAVASVTAIGLQLMRWSGGERTKLLKDADNTAADASETIVSAAKALIEPLERRIASQDLRIDTLETENKTNRQQIGELKHENTLLKKTISNQAARISELERENAELRRAERKLGL